MASISSVLALLAGAFVPLGPDMVIQGVSGPLHLFGNTDAGVFLLLALFWLNTAFLSLSERQWQDSDHAVRRIAGDALLRSLPTLLVVLSVFTVAGALSPYAGIGFQVASLINLQGGWNGMRWIAFMQPVALVLWIGCTAPSVKGPQAGALVPGRLLALNYDLLTSAIFFGAWQGPVVDQAPWLGIAYSGLKVALVAFLRTWIAVSHPTSHPYTLGRRVWVWCAPLSAFNLLITATIVALR
jgi:NADH:ubiquinone oxidoreductase subunit H